MRNKQKIALVIALVAILVAIVFRFLREEPIASAPSIVQVGPRANPAEKAQVQAAVIQSASLTNDTKQGVPKLLLPVNQEMRVSSVLSDLYFDLVEKKGAAAYATKYVGKTATLNVPGLRLTEDQIANALLPKLKSIVGIEKATALWSNPDSRKVLLNELAFNRLTSDASYIFKKTGDEGNVAKLGSLADAAFYVEWSLAANGSTPKANFTYDGFTYRNRYEVGLGWSALAKMPPGYLRSEPIRGDEPRPEGALIGISEVGSNTVEILHGDYPGSSETRIITPRK